VRIDFQLDGTAGEAPQFIVGRNISASIPATIRAMVWSVISGNAFLQKPKKVR